MRDPELKAFSPRYEHLRELGRGGMGQVHLVHDAYLDRDVALKVLHHAPRTSDELERAQREFRLLARVEHPAIARAYDFGFAGDMPYFTSDFIPGSPLSSTGGQVENPAALIELCCRLAEAVEFLHAHGVLHLDIKPSNVVLMSEPQQRPVLVDFGLWRESQSVESTPPRRGSLPYMAPEYFRGGDIGPWTDLYSLGVTLYELATGQLPRPGGTMYASTSNPKGDEAWTPVPAAPSRLQPSLPADLDHIILKCLSLDPGARGSSPADLLATLHSGVKRQRTRVVRTVETLIGREREIDRALEYLLPPKHTESQPILAMTGPRGVGLSHLLREIKWRTQTRGLPCYLERGTTAATSEPGTVLRCLGAHITENTAARQRWEDFRTRLARPQPSRLRSQADSTAEVERRLRHASEIALAVRAASTPFALLIDDLQSLDEVSVALVVDLVGVLRSEPRDLQIRIVLTYRDEGSSVRLLRELSQSLLNNTGSMLTLSPLSVEDTATLHSHFRRTRTHKPSALEVFQRTDGLPERIVRHALALDDAFEPSPDPGHHSSEAALDDSALEILRTLATFARPVRTEELARALSRPGAHIEAQLCELSADGRVTSDLDPHGSAAWSLAPHGSVWIARQPARSPASVHERIARALVRDRKGGAGRLVEAVQHFAAAGDTESIIRHGPAAARYLTSMSQNHAALEVLRRVYEALPTTQRDERVATALDLADLYARVGSLADGVDLLRSLLRMRPPPTGSQRPRIQLHLAVLHSRQGEFKRAAALFAEALPNDLHGEHGMDRHEVLHYVNEYAAMKGFTGDYDGAEELCVQGLKLAGRSRAANTREVVLNIYATRAGMALRNFDFHAAIQYFERALEIADAIGSVSNRAVVLNNLGIVLSQCDRYAEAVRAFEEAEQTCLQLDEGPSLVSIHCNLAVLHAKRGAFERMDAAIRSAEALGPSSVSSRQRFFFEHTLGLCLVYRGRYRAAQPHLEAAIELGEAMGDAHVVTFDRIYRAEALLFQAEYEVAERVLVDLLASEPPERQRRMALSRLALLYAITARPAQATNAASDHHLTPPSPPIPFIDAGDDVYLGWAKALSGDLESALSHLRRAETFFSERGFAPGLSLARWARAEASLFGPSASDSPVDPGDHNDFTAVLWPLLRARLAASPELGKLQRSTTADLLANAGAALVGNPLPEWSARVDRLRGELRGDEKATREAKEARRKLVRHLSAAEIEAYLDSPHWQVWCGDVLPPAALAARTASPDAVTASIGPTQSGLRQIVVAHSSAMQNLLRSLDRLRKSDAPLLITGETGTGKELVARLVHEESRRSDEEFRVVDCTAIPTELFEAELFGARAGAFTSIEDDRRGLVESVGDGTILFDEIGDLDLDAQAKLLRLVDTLRYRAVGDEEEKTTSARLVFTSAKNLEDEVRSGRFRADFHHRVRVLTIDVPPLRDRPEDFADLIARFFAESTQSGSPSHPARQIDDELIQRLRSRSWPGNVRQLRNYILRLRLENTGTISASALRESSDDDRLLFPRNVLASQPLDVLRERLERDYVVYHFRRLGGDTNELCAFLGLGRRQLYRRCERLKISLRSERARFEGRDRFL